MDIDPQKLILIISEPTEIKKRLEKRDNKFYDLSLIEDFQNRRNVRTRPERRGPPRGAPRIRWRIR